MVNNNKKANISTGLKITLPHFWFKTSLSMIQTEIFIHLEFWKKGTLLVKLYQITINNKQYSEHEQNN